MEPPITTSTLHNSGLNNMDPSFAFTLKTNLRDSNTTHSSRKNHHSCIPQILIQPPPESKRHIYNPFHDHSPTPEKNYSPRRPRHQYYDPHYLNTFQTKYIPPHTRTRKSPIVLNEWYERNISSLETKIADVAKRVHGPESKDEEKERAARVRWWMDRRDEMRRQLRELEVEEWEDREKEQRVKEEREKGEKEKDEKERQEKEEKEKEKEKERKRISEESEGGKKVAGGRRRWEGRDYELACKRLGKMFSDSRRIIA
ncbi:MAG: hypothetical protein Q9192_005094 [Flavoplaca navasiana]